MKAAPSAAPVLRSLAFAAVVLVSAHSHAESAASVVPVVLDRSIRFENATGGAVVLEPGNYLGEVSDKPPLRLRSERSDSTWSLSAKVSAHKEKLGRPKLASVAGKEGAHHLLLLLPGGRAIDAAGSTSTVATRAVPTALDAKEITTSLAATRGEEQRLLKRSLEPRSLPDKPESTTFEEGVFRNRVIVKFRDAAQIRVSEQTENQPHLAMEGDLLASRAVGEPKITTREVESELDTANGILTRDTVEAWGPLFTRDEEFLEDARTDSESATGEELADLSNYYAITLKSEEAGETVADELNHLDSVELAYLAPIGQDAADLPPPTPNFTASQGYLGPAPTGIDARFAWTQTGGPGDQIRVIDVEQGWNIAHEDLPGAFFQNGKILGGGSRQHGTAVLGEIVGGNNGFGITGIAHRANYGVVSAQRNRSFLIFSWDEYNLADAINVAASKLRKGDVLLIEQHSKGPSSGLACACNCSQHEFVAMEYFQAEFDAIRAATTRGIHVVEAAGNGGMDLDHARYGKRFDRSVRDSGAILVGAGSSTNRTPLCFTNFGTRVDVQAWGQNVMTTGYGDHAKVAGADDKQWYTKTFSGTSSASPIVTGAVASLEGILRGAGQNPMKPADMRKLLVDTGTAQGGTNHIGPLPDLRAAIAQLGLEDCTSVDPSTVEARESGDRWMVVEGESHQLLDFAEKAAADEAADVIKHYGFTKHCFVGRPDSSFDYWLVGDQAPSGAKSGEDCVGFDPDALRVTEQGGSFTLAEGDHGVADFGDKQNEASAALDLIRRYGFNQQCFVARPNPPMTYWRH
jgi:serine protease